MRLTGKSPVSCYKILIDALRIEELRSKNVMGEIQVKKALLYAPHLPLQSAGDKPTLAPS